MNKEKMFKAIHQWTLLYGDVPLPEDVEEWYDEEIVSSDADIVVSYEEEDVQDELN